MTKLFAIVGVALASLNPSFAQEQKPVPDLPTLRDQAKEQKLRELRAVGNLPEKLEAPKRFTNELDAYKRKIDEDTLQIAIKQKTIENAEDRVNEIGPEIEISKKETAKKVAELEAEKALPENSAPATQKAFAERIKNEKKRGEEDVKRLDQERKNLPANIKGFRGDLAKAEPGLMKDIDNQRNQHAGLIADVNSVYEQGMKAGAGPALAGTPKCGPGEHAQTDSVVKPAGGSVVSLPSGVSAITRTAQ